ncbi:PilZ domain-containing protein [Treponema sp.]|uniref:PilZ domain-containing protein n=1 Tax=Treponema sp. TaxID=166 RepID=UPI003F0F5490
METGSPIEARIIIGGLVYTFVALFFLAAAASAAIYLFYIKHRSHRSSIKWIEANKNRETRISDIRKIARDANLDSSEKKFLWHICRRNKVRNILFSYRSEAEMHTLFKNEFHRLNSNGIRNEEKTSLLFSLRYKLEKLYNKKHSITSTRSLRPGQQIRIIDSQRMPHDATVQKNQAEGLYVEITPELQYIKPKQLSKFMINFSSSTGILYQCALTAVRYEIIPSGKELLLATHSSSLKVIQKRTTKRKGTNFECLFSAVKQIGTGRKTQFKVLPKKFPGRVIDISAGGCKVSCSLPITKDQYIQLYFKIPGLTEHQAQGLIIKTKKSMDEKTFVLYIKFTDINITARNDIYAAIYDYL